jgi:plasmid replication initiation protein
MSKTATIGLLRSTTLFDRLLAALDRILMTSARVSIRNSDLPYFGL